ncbi:hypothetical protein BC832DRAFT_362122 [Gaertneriomyces semiglobifer]|nr:hypothetical protein BC832DRAFT_362122 [Gaertneriomyces semiglobifer]
MGIHVLFWASVFDILSIVYLLRVVIGNKWNGAKPSIGSSLVPLWRTLLGITNALALMNVLTFVIFSFRERMPSAALWFLRIEVVFRFIATLAILFWWKATIDRFLWTQSSIAFVESILFTLAALILRIVQFMQEKLTRRALAATSLTKQQRTLLLSIIVGFFPLSISAVVFVYTEGIQFETSWNFVNVTALTIGYGNTVIHSAAGKIFLITFGNFMLICVAFFILSLKSCLLLPRYTGVKAIVFGGYVFLFILFGAVIFMFLEDWSFLNSIYFVWVTLTTIGYGDVVPSKPLAFEFWMLYVYVAACILATILSVASESMHARVRERVVPVRHSSVNTLAP